MKSCLPNSSSKIVFFYLFSLKKTENRMLHMILTQFLVRGHSLSPEAETDWVVSRILEQIKHTCAMRRAISDHTTAYLSKLM